MDGRIEVPAAVAAKWPKDTRAQLTAVPSLPLVDPVPIIVEPRHFEGDELVLEVPAFGTLDVLLVNRTREELTPDVAVELRLQVLLEPRPDAPSPSFWMGPFTAAVSNGRACFPFVPVGLTARLATSPDAPFVRDFVDTPPLRSGGEVRTVELTLSRLKPRLSLRLIDAAGAPAAGSVFEVCEVGRGHLHGSDRDEKPLTADSLGRLRLDLERFGRGDAGRTIRLISKAEPPRFVEVPVSVDAVPRHLDLGDVMLQVAPVIAAGRVVNGAGAAIEGARVTAVVRDFDTSCALEDSKNVSDTLGRFELRGVGFEGSMALAVRPPPGYRNGDAVEAVVGARDLEIVLDRSRSLCGEVRVDAGLEALDGRLFAYPVDAAGAVLADGAPVHGGTATGAATYRFVDLRRAPIEMKFVLTTETEPIFVMNVPTARDEGDVMAPSADLRGKLRLHRLTVVDSGGRPVPRADIRAGSALEDLRRSPYFGFLEKTSNLGTIELLASTPAPMVRVSARGFESCDALLIGNDSTVVLAALR